MADWQVPFWTLWNSTCTHALVKKMGSRKTSAWCQHFEEQCTTTGSCCEADVLEANLTIVWHHSRGGSGKKLKDWTVLSADAGGPAACGSWCVNLWLVQGGWVGGGVKPPLLGGFWGSPSKRFRFRRCSLVQSGTLQVTFRSNFKTLESAGSCLSNHQVGLLPQHFQLWKERRPGTGRQWSIWILTSSSDQESRKQFTRLFRNSSIQQIYMNTHQSLS